MGAGLDNGKSIRRGNTDKWKHIFTEGKDADGMTQTTPVLANFLDEANPNEGLEFSRKAPREPPFLNYPPPKPSTPYPLVENGPCDPAHPRIYHIFWAGPFTDKPYIAILSFLFTQNVGLHLPRDSPPSKEVCRPQIWLWINPGPAAAIANPRARSDMYETLAANPWSAPFLHPRFEDVVKFKLWNTTEQLDGVPEIKDEWRIFGGSIFNSGGYVYEVKIDKEAEKASTAETSSLVNDTLTTAEEPRKQQKNGIYDRLGSKSQQDYDRMSVILSDMARFILCHRFGGTYLDADTIFLRDWEELWGWKGAFAYRWSRLEKYNTAVLRLNKGSALGSFLFRTALKNDFDFHPMTVSRYTKEGHMEGLLLRLPDALFDSAWLNTEGYQTDRPPFPYLTE
jgi:DDB1- and CUL4-associated factor 13